MLPVVCAGCSELLDRGTTICRVCGEDNSADALEAGTVEIDSDLQLDVLQPWSQIKHAILEKYLTAYTTILRKQHRFRRYVYIDAFAGAGVAIDLQSDDLVAAGALRALEAEPRFSEYHFIELDDRKARVLQQLVANRPEARVHRGDYRSVLPGLLERCRYEDYARGLCLLDPYGLSVDYSLLASIAGMRSIEIFFNFMLVSANRNVLWRRPALVSPERRQMMTRVWGNDRWVDELYDSEPDLFGGQILTKSSNERVIAAYRRRLFAAGFGYVPEPIPMRNRLSAPLYYLFFCSHNKTGAEIVTDIFNRYR